MKNEEYKEIKQELLNIVCGIAYSVENLEKHVTENLNIVYIGSAVSGYLDNNRINGKRIIDYFEDNTGNYWYRKRALLPTGEMVSMDEYLFGKKSNNIFYKKKRGYGYDKKRKIEK